MTSLRCLAIPPTPLRLTNPIAADLDQLRPTPIATLALAAQRNGARGYPDVRCLSSVPALRDASERQRRIAAGLRAGAAPRNCRATAIRPIDGGDGRQGELWAALTAAGIPMEALMVTGDAPDFYHPGRSATVAARVRNRARQFGELHPRVLAARSAWLAVAFDLDSTRSPNQGGGGKRRLISRRSSRSAATLHFSRMRCHRRRGDKAARGAERTLIAGVALFDVFQGDRLPRAKVLGYRSGVSAPRTDADRSRIEALLQKVVAAVTKATGATLR